MSELNPRILSGYGLVEAPFDAVAKQFGSHKRADQAEMRVRKTTRNVEEVLAHLSIRTHPATRLVLVDRGPWTAVLTNQKSGSDFADYQHWADKSLSVRTIRVLDSKARWVHSGAMRARQDYDARILELHGADGGSIRVITCANDGGRWVFETSGEPFSIEASFAYDAQRKPDRFTRQNLAELLAFIGPGVLTEVDFLHARRYALLEERHKPDTWQQRILAAACTLEEAEDPAHGYYERGLGYVPFMNTHYPSVIADFERAMAFNPTYEPRVRVYLETAHRLAGNVTSDRSR